MSKMANVDLLLKELLRLHKICVVQSCGTNDSIFVEREKLLNQLLEVYDNRIINNNVLKPTI